MGKMKNAAGRHHGGRVVNLNRWRQEITRALKGDEWRVELAPHAYEEFDGIPGILSHPTFFEDAVVIHAFKMAPHRWQPVLEVWELKSGKPRWRCFRINIGGVLSEVFPDGGIENLFIPATAADAAAFLNSLPKDVLRPGKRKARAR